MSIYQPNIPTGLINLDVDYKNIQNNFSQLNTTFSKNHKPIDNQTTDNGKHTIVQMVNNVNIPGSLAPNEGTLYVKTAASISNLFFTPDNSTDEYQITRVDSTNFSTFSTYTQYPSSIVNANQVGGWTFLPGGMLFQYGTSSTSNSNPLPVIFPVPFASNDISLTLAREGNAGNSGSYTNLTTTGFIFYPGGSSVNKFCWHAVGK